jgi:SSS family solute:Na+ symporter
MSSKATIVALLLMGYNLVTQLFPALVFSLMKKNFVTKAGAFAGIVAGVATVAAITISETSVGRLFPFLPQAIQDINVGIIALIVNAVVLTAVSAATRSLSAAPQASEKAM